MEMSMENSTLSQAWGDYEIKTSSLMWKRIVGNKMFVVGGIVVFILVLWAILAPVLTQYDPTKMDFSSKLASPSWKHLMGTDHFGRDIFARIIYGARISFQVGIATVLIGFVSGIIIGAIAGFIGGFWDGLIMRIMDSLLAFPPLLLAIGLAASMKPSLTTVCISIGVVYIPRFAYVMRGSVLVEREKEYVEAARAIGQSNTKILLKHIWPSCISPVIVLATVIFAIAIIAEATLSFLGVGIPPPAPSWGTMLSESRRYLSSSIYPALFPGLAISIAVLGSNLLGDGLRDILDPRIYTKIK
jgi:ABC-type dipeptide/oligopeptide/nickel transport system permease subunit